MIDAVNPIDRLRQDTFQRFCLREETFQGRDLIGRRLKYWDGYVTAIAGLPTQIRQSGLLATIAMSAPDRRLPKPGEDPVLDVLTDLKWAVGSDNQDIGPWLDSLFRMGTGAVLIERERDFMNTAQAIKQIAGLRRAFSRFEKDIASASSDLSSAQQRQDG